MASWEAHLARKVRQLVALQIELFCAPQMAGISGSAIAPNGG